MSRANDKGHYFRFIILLQAHKWQYNNLESNKRLTLILSVVYEAELNIRKLSADAKNPTGLGLKRGREICSFSKVKVNNTPILDQVHELFLQLSHFIYAGIVCDCNFLP